MKKKLFNQDKESNKELAFVKQKVSFSIDAKKIGKKFSLFFLAMVIITGVSVGVLMALNSFFNTHYFEFRSPVIFQQPILLHERDLISPLPEALSFQVEASEPTPTPKPDYRSMVKIKTAGCIDAHPELVEPLVNAFPDEPTAILDLVCRESGLQKGVINKSSGACGLFQAYPCDKLKCNLNDVDCQIAWGKQYISNRYGSVEAALLFHDQKGWY